MPVKTPSVHTCIAVFYILNVSLDSNVLPLFLFLSLARSLALFLHSGFARTHAWERCGGQIYSHSMVAGGFDEISYTTRFTPRTSLMMRFDMRPNTSYGMWYQSAVM